MPTKNETPIAPAVGAEEPQFDWVMLRADMNHNNQIETQKEKMLRKIKENPFVPIGCMATAAALTVGLWSFRRGKKELSQNMMRLRVGAQGFTIVALIVGVFMSASKINK